MKKFLAVFTGSPGSVGSKKWDSMDETTKKKQTDAGMTAWGNWIKKNQKFIIETGAPLGKTKQVDPKGISDIKNQMAVYTIVQAESHEEAAKLFLEHPHFMIFPGDLVEVMECLPIPGT